MSQWTGSLQARWRISGTFWLHIGDVRFKFFAQVDDNLADTLFYKRNYVEESDLQFFLELSRMSRVVVDVGANTGIYTIVSAKGNANATVLAIEPNHANCTRLRTNISLNGLTNVKVVEKALGDVNTTVDFFVPSSGQIIDTSSVLRSFSESTYSGEGINWKAARVQQVTFDGLMDELGVDTVDLIKIDVEGYEIQLFEGARKFFGKCKPLILCEIFIDDARKNYFDLVLKQFGYTPYVILSSGLIRLDDGLVPSFGGLNYFFATFKAKDLFTPFADFSAALRNLSASENLGLGY